MGGLSSKLSVFVLFPATTKYKSQLEYLGLCENDVLQLYILYNKICIEKSEQAKVDSFIKMFHFEDIPFMTRVLSTIVDPKSGNILNFRDFVFILWHFCTIERDMACLTFDLYDANDDKNLDVTEADMLVREVYGDRFEKVKGLPQLISKMEYHSKPLGGVKRFYFKEFVAMNPLMIYPCFEYCRKLQEHTLGTSKWEKLTQHRIVLLRGAYKTAKELRALAKESDPSRTRKTSAAQAKTAALSSQLAAVAAPPEVGDDGEKVGEGTPALSRQGSLTSLCESADEGDIVTVAGDFFGPAPKSVLSSVPSDISTSADTLLPTKNAWD